MKKFYISLLLFLTYLSVYSQEIRNIRVAQTGNRVNILFDLSGSGQASKISLFYTNNNGQTWNGPLKFISGDINDIPIPATDKRIVWDAQSELSEITGELQFKVIAEFSTGIKPTVKVPDKDILYKEKPWLNDPKFKKHQNAAGLWWTFSMFSAGVGGYAILNSNNLYDDYLKARTTAEASALRKKTNNMDILKPVAFGTAGLSAVLFLIHSSHKSKVKSNYKAQPVTYSNGGGILLTYYF